MLRERVRTLQCPEHASTLRAPFISDPSGPTAYAKNSEVNAFAQSCIMCTVVNHGGFRTAINIRMLLFSAELYSNVARES